MMETIVLLKPSRASGASATTWYDAHGRRTGCKPLFRHITPDHISTEDLVDRDESRRCAFPGVSNAWTMPIKNRIDMLTTGMRTPVGVKIFGADLQVIERIGTQIEATAARRCAGTRSVFAERTGGGYFLDFDLEARRAGALRPVDRRCAVGGDERDRRRERHHDGRRPRALSGERALLRAISAATWTGWAACWCRRWAAQPDPAGAARRAEADVRALRCCATRTAC